MNRRKSREEIPHRFDRLRQDGPDLGGAGGGSWIAGTEGTLVFDAWDGPVRLYRTGAVEPRLVVCPSTSAYALELHDLLAAIESGAGPENSGINGLRNIGLDLAIYYSIATRQRLDFRDGLPLDVPADYQYRGASSIK